VKKDRLQTFSLLVSVMRPVYVIIIACVLVALYLIFVWPTQRLFRSFDNFKRNAKRSISGNQLQTWAASLIAPAPTNATPRVSELGTNFPAQLLGLYHRPPYIQIQETNANQPASIFLMWGGGMIGHCGFEIGPTNFVSHRSNARAWQPGVYFWSDYPPK